MRSRLVRHLPALVLLLAVATVPIVAAPAASPAGPTSPTGVFANGTVLPNGRLVTPAGRTVDLGDFPLGVAVSPDGRLAVAINSGQGTGLNSGRDSYCTNRRQGMPCPYRDNLPSTIALRNTAGDPGTRTPDESLSVVNLRTGRVDEVKAVPTSYDATPGAKDRFNYFYVGVVFSPDGRRLYAAGGGNDAVYDFPVRRDRVGSRPTRTVVLPSATGGATGTPANALGLAGFIKGLAVTPNGRYLLVTHEFNGTLDIVDTKTGTLTQQVSLAAPLPMGGAYPYGVAVGRDGGTAYVALQGQAQVAVVRLVGGQGTVVGTVPVGDHPTAVAVSPDGSQLYVANAADDTLSILSIDRTTGLPTPARSVALHALPGESLGSAPNAIAVSPDGQRLYVTLAGDDAVAVLGTQAALTATTLTSRTPAGGRPAAPVGSPAPGAYGVLGLIPAGWYPSAVATNGDGSQLYVVSAKGLGSRYPDQNRRGDIRQGFEYDANNMPGLLQTVPAPRGTAAFDAGTRAVMEDIAFAGAAAGRDDHNPVPAAPYATTIGSALPITAPIQHVIEIVRENRTFDQQLGDVARDTGRQIDANADYAIFGREVTPNTHAFVGDIAPTSAISDPAYATSDNFYSDGEASIDGHWWTSSADANDYIQKSWRQYYSPRNHPYDPTAPIAAPHNCSIFQSALQRRSDTAGLFTFRDYGELVGLANPQLNPPSLTGGAPDIRALCKAIPAADFDPLGAAASTGTVGGGSPIEPVGTNLNLIKDNRQNADAFLQDIGLDRAGNVVNPAASLRNFSYIIMGGDHTAGLQSGGNTPRSRVAQNDAGIALIVQALSHSTYWRSTAIFIMEDDSQDGLDHEDGHRNQLYVVSPYAKHTGTDGLPGYVAHRHYSQASVLKTIDLLMGFPYLSTYDQNAPALYDLFQDKDSDGSDPLQQQQDPQHTLTAQDLRPYTVQPEPGFIDESAAQYAAANPAMADVLKAETKRLDLSGIDRAGPELEIINWQMARPNSPVPAQLLRERRVWAARQGAAADGDG